VQDKQIDNARQLIDDEHKALASKIDSIGKAFIAGIKEDLDIQATLRDLLALTSRHFMHEEELMESMGTRIDQSHKRDHQYLLKSLSDFIANFVDGKIPNSPEIGRNLLSWLNLHIKKYDSQFEHLEKPIEDSPTSHSTSTGV
jgi:hemerythrin-like metal-binding protein